MANTYLTRTSSSTGNRRTWTFSAWVKRSQISNADATQMLFGTYTDSSNRLEIGFHNANNLVFKEKSGGSTTIDFTSTQLFKDVHGWYNIVVAVDTTQGTNTNRVKIYVNGEQITAWNDSTYPSEDYDTLMNVTGRAYNVGQEGSNSYYFDGYMSHVHLIDGTACAVTEFGATDTTTNEWKHNTPSSSYGTNGFFILRDDNAVTDRSGQGNNFTVGGGTLTKCEDNPSNVFATINPLQIEGVSGSPALAFAHGNTKVTRSGNWRGHMSTMGVNQGKWYWEVKQTGNVALGIGKFGGDVDHWQYLAGGQSWLGDKNDVWISYNNGGTQVKYTGGSSGGNWHPVYSDGEIISIAFDADNGTIWQGINGTWMNSATETEIENGTTGNAMYSGITIGMDFFGALGAVENGNLEYNFGNGYFGTTAVSSAGTNNSGFGVFEYDVPDGFTAICTKGLNE